MEGEAGFFEGGAGFGGVDFNRREGAVVDAEDFFYAGPLGGDGGVRRVHGEVPAEADGGPVEAVELAEDLHVVGERGVAGVPEGAVGGLNDEAAGVATAGAVGEGGGVDGVDILDASEGEVDGAAVVEGDRFLAALAAEPGGDLEVGDEGGAGALEEGLGVGEVVLVAVGDEDVVGLEGADVDPGPGS